MKTIVKILSIIVLLIYGCKKEQLELPKENLNTQFAATVGLDEARTFMASLPEDSTKSLQGIEINWSFAKNRNGNLVIPLRGQPVYQGYKQGYREIIFTKNKLQQLEAHILEIIPDATYLQKTMRSTSKTFTGRVFDYNLNYQLKGGRLYSEGKIVGEIKNLSEREKIDYANKSLKEKSSPYGVQGKIMRAMLIESCTWIQSSYIDAEGDFTVHSERVCSYSYVGNDGPSYFNDAGGGGSYTNTSSGGGGGGTGSTTIAPPPPPSNLPGENNNKVDPKKMMDCFAQITSPNAAFVVRVYVVEPQPGTSFNVGANSFGHVAISLTKSSGNTSITQTIGFYPTGSGFEKLNSKSQMLDNGLGEYNMSATYYVSDESFQKVIDYVGNPPQNYHFTDFNCSAFVYGAGLAGNIGIPDPTTQIGISGPGGGGFAKTPAGMASALREQKVKNPNLDISDAGGRMPESKGPCN
ncbi:hypothetical protein [Pedobacter agri]|uniref:hypothetical protein n=1 Tax=Pedobacter agri TaxID=454586 RepID=UPI00292E4186|nr:hypothetical protein [Pedobacter agri]